MKKQTPLVSIIMSVFNNESFLKDSIESVLNQTYSDWEFIIINDASTDDTDKILKKYEKKDQRIHVITNKTNEGLANNLNKGIRVSKGKFIARIDGDDVWINRNKLKKQILFLRQNEQYGLVGTWAKIIDDNNKIINCKKYPCTDEDIKNYILIENCFFHSSVVIRKKILNKIGIYDSSIRTAEDYNLWMRIGLTSKLYNMSEYLINYRQNPNGINSTKSKLQINETLQQITQFKKNYPNYYKAYILWKLRLYVPKGIKNIAANMLMKLVAGKNA